MSGTITTDSKAVQTLIEDELLNGQGIHPTTVGELVVHSINSQKLLDTLSAQWEDLSQQSASPNAFYEPAFFQAASSLSTGKEDWHIIIVLEPKTKTLVGFFPFVLTKKFGILNQLSLWKSELSYLTTPLIRSGYEEKVLESLLLHIKSLRPRIHMIEFPLMLAEGRIHQELQTLVRNKLLTTFQFDHYSRAELRIGRDYESYVKDSVGGHHLRGYKRQLRNLNKLGQVEFRVGTDPKSASCWSEWFLDLEAEGWKGREGTAMKQHSEEATFFHKLLSNGMQQNRLEMLGLFLNGEPIALGCTLLSSSGGFTYKIAFNEEYKKYSPGILLQLHITERLLNDQGLQWLDSCAVPNHPMINRLWRERRSIQHLLISTGGPIINVMISSLPLLRAIKRIVIKSKRIQ